MSSRSFRSSTKMNYSRGIVPSQANAPGSNFYVNLYSNSLLLNQLNNFDRNNPIPRPPVPPVSNTKIIAILNFNDPVYDQPIIKTLNYYFKSVPIFYEFPIVNYGGDFDKLLELLNESYNKGFRYFLTATLTPALSACIEWFADHPDTQAVTSQTRLQVHSIPKNIYRTAFGNIMPVTEKEIIGNNDAVFYIYATINQTIISWNDYLKNRCEALGIPYYSYPVSSSSTISDTSFVDVTMNEIQQLVTDNNYNKISISSTLVEWQNIFYNKFVQGVTTSPSNSTFYNISFALPNITETPAVNYFSNVPLYAQNSGFLNSSPLWREGFENLGNDNFSRSTLNMMIILYKMELTNGYIFELGAHSDALLFNLVTRDQTYESYVYELFTADGFEPHIIYFRSDSGLIYKSDF